MEEFSGRRIYTLDDSSGMCVECTCIMPVKEPSGLDVLGVPQHLDQGVRRLDQVVSAKNAKAVVDAKVDGKDNGKSKAGEEIKAPERGVRNPDVPWDMIDVGSVVKVKGRISSFRDMMQVEVVSVVMVKTTDGEVRFWNEAGTFREDVLGKEWVVSKEMEEKLRREAEGGGKRRGVKKGDSRKETEKVSRKRRDGDTIEDRNAAKHLIEEETRKRKRPEERRDDGERKAAKRLLERETAKRVEEEERKKPKQESATAHEKEKEKEKEKKKQDVLAAQERKQKRRMEFERANANGGGVRSRSGYPSLAVREAAKGKYDALGI